MAKYKVKNTNILHNDTLYKIGEIIELDKNQAKKLGDVIVPVQEQKTETKTTKPATKTKESEQKKDTKTETKKEENDSKDGGNQ